MAELVDFVENVFESDAIEIMRKITLSPGQILARKKYVLEALRELWLPQPIEELPQLKDGELRPVFSGSIGNIAGQAVSRALVPGGDETEAEARRRRLELQSLLLYAHSVALRNPLGVIWTLLRGKGGQIRLRCQDVSDSEFLVGIYSICDTAKLAKGGVLLYIDPPTPVEADYDLNEMTATIGRNLYNSYAVNVMDQGMMHGIARTLLSQAIFQMLALTPASQAGTASLLIPTDMDSQAFTEISLQVKAQLAGDSGQGMISDRDTELLRQLITLSLPGVERVTLKDVVHIRDDEAFGVFRVKMRGALNDANGEPDIGSARRVVADHMKAAQAEFDIKTRKGVLGDAMVSDVVGWGVGAAVAGTIAGWQGVAATLLGKTVTEMLRHSPRASERALRNHFIALSDSRVSSVHSDVGLLSNENRRLWGLRDPELEASNETRIDEAVSDFLGILGGFDESPDGE